MTLPPEVTSIDSRESHPRCSSCDYGFDRRMLIRRTGIAMTAIASGIFLTGCGLEGSPVDPRVVIVARKDVPAIGARPFKSLHGKFFLARNGDGVLAMAWGCTHLGCATSWSEQSQQFKCPCHGATFELDGSRIEGPALRPLDLFQITAIEDGDVHVLTVPWIMRDAYSSDQATPYE